MIYWTPYSPHTQAQHVINIFIFYIFFNLLFNSSLSANKMHGGAEILRACLPLRPPCRQISVVLLGVSPFYDESPFFSLPTNRRWLEVLLLQGMEVVESPTVPAVTMAGPPSLSKFLQRNKLLVNTIHHFILQTE